MNKIVFYCSESQAYSKPYRCYRRIEERLVSWFKQRDDYRLCHIEKPEIYKHAIAFRYLEGFTPKSLHLIMRKLENIRLLKNAYNVLILPVVITETEMKRTSESPFQNVKRMLSLVDEIWTTQQENLERLKGRTPSVEHFDDEISMFDKINQYHADN